MHNHDGLVHDRQQGRIRSKDLSRIDIHGRHNTAQRRDEIAIVQKRRRCFRNQRVVLIFREDKGLLRLRDGHCIATGGDRIEIGLCRRHIICRLANLHIELRRVELDERLVERDLIPWFHQHTNDAFRDRIGDVELLARVDDAAPTNILRGVLRTHLV